MLHKWTLQRGQCRKTLTFRLPSLRRIVNLTDGQLAFSSNGSTFPMGLHVISNPFPAAGDFAVEFDLTYTGIGDSGNGIRICGDPSTMR